MTRNWAESINSSREGAGLPPHKKGAKESSAEALIQERDNWAARLKTLEDGGEIGGWVGADAKEADSIRTQIKEIDSQLAQSSKF